ncbi:MAG: ribonuclease P protein component [Candidatus Omnitrophica bacterium]|nr:ribonuclease P protein component [Candidatus Omnitrophota bacterium]
MKLTRVFRHVSRRGRWAHGPVLSVGGATNQEGFTRVGLRVKRGLKSAPQRNRLKRQLRAVIRTGPSFLRTGLDLIVVIHPRTLPVKTTDLDQEFRLLCKRIAAI